ncbi:MAG: hypothetical protein RJB66_1253 [Pseudomonadota bacterium]|jgi:anti-anti-sigma factor
MRLSSKSIGSWSIFEVMGTIDSIHTKVFIDSLADYIDGGRKNIIMDLTKASFLSIGAIRYINQMSQYLSGSGGRLVIMGANERIKRHIDIFVSWKELREINSIWEVIPLQMEHKFKEAIAEILVEPAIE